MMKTFAVLAIVPTLVSGPVFAQANTVPGAVSGGAYVIDPNHTQVGFTVSHMGFSLYSGRFSNVSGALDLEPKTVSASTVSITVPVASVSTTSAKLDDELKDADWLDAKQFPDMTFKSTKVIAGGQGTAKVAGNLTLHGVTRPVTLQVRFIGSGINPLDKKYTAGFELSGDIERSEFGVKKYLPLIGDTVHLTIAAAFEKK